MPRRTFAEHAPEGLYFRNDIISKKASDDALQYISRFDDKFTKVRPSSKGVNRRATFGFQPTARREIAAPELSTELIRLYQEAVQGVPEFRASATPKSCTVNIYPANTSLGAHKDGGAHVDEVVGVTLHENPNKASVLQFAKDDCFYDVPTPHGSVYIMTGSSYHDWTHARKKNSKQGGNVISFTFRTPSAGVMSTYTRSHSA